MRCAYCMAENMEFLPRDDVLSYDELDRLCRIFIDRGVTRLRLTGGEPLVRRDIDSFITRIGGYLRPAGTLEELTLTTNGSQFTRHARALADAGVRRINVSLDTLDPEKFARITRRGRLEQTLDGIRAARAAGLDIRINTVAMAGVNDDEFDDLIRWCGEEGADLCLIETMPMGQTGENRCGQYLSLSDVRKDLAQRWTLEPSPVRSASGPARYLTIAETGRRLGFITPMSHNFCETCNRVRLSCTGRFYTCLGSEGSTDLRAILRRGGTDADILAAINEALSLKPARHDFLISAQEGTVRGPSRYMSVTGG